MAAAVTAGALAAGVLAAGCGSQPPRRLPAGTSGSARPVAAGASAAGNQSLARREARRLLSLVRVPDGARLLTSVPRFAGPASRPQVASLTDEVRAWRVALPFRQAAAWLREHPPARLPAVGSGSGTSGTRATQFAEYSYRGPASAAWRSAELDVEVVSAGPRTTVLRADGMVAWLDPVPLRDTSAGPRMRVTVAGGCPARLNPLARVANQGTDLAGRLLPAAAPTAGLECRYYGANGPAAFGLRGASRLDAAQARGVAARMSAIPLRHPVSAVTGCPFDDESAEVIALSYPHRGDVDLWVGLSGCTFVSNGFIRADTF